MSNEYYQAIDEMEKKGVDEDYIIGWQGGYHCSPEREEQRVNEAYSAGYEDGKERNTANIDKWIKK